MSLEGKEILVTGCAGFIGAALVSKLLDSNANVIGIDNINSYYSKELKLARLEEIKKKEKQSQGRWDFFQVSLEDSESLQLISSNHNFDIVVHLAAQAGVRYSLSNPDAYVSSNLVGFGNILELCRYSNIENFIYASSSSVYGGNKSLPFKEDDNVNHPVSLYAATKRSNELMAHSYSDLYNIPVTGLRFFTVYGPLGRPDMAPMIFAKAITENKPINVFNYGKMKRDFTYIDDVVEAIARCCDKPASIDKNFDRLNPNKFSSFAPYRIFNIGNSEPIELIKFIEILEQEFDKTVIKNFLPMQRGDVTETAANTDLLYDWVNFKPTTSIRNGIKRFVDWYKMFYRI